MRSQKRRIKASDFHPHILARMQQRGVLSAEIETVLNPGWDATDAKIGTEGKVWVFEFNTEWEGVFYREKEVTVYYRVLY